MSSQPSASKRPNYGIDAPNVVRGIFLGGLAAVVIGCVFLVLLKQGKAEWARFCVWPFFLMGGFLILEAGVMVWGSKFGKLRLRDRILNALPWRGDEMVLDVGCGHGLMLIGAAKRLRTGKAVGVDLWQKEDQAGNSREATWENVQIEGVAERAELKDGDARKLPFADNTFDVVLSSWALHNIYDAPGRAAAVREIVRVMKPGGRVTLVDIRHVAEYAQVIRENRMRDVKMGGPNFLFVIPTRAVTAVKAC